MAWYLIGAAGAFGQFAGLQVQGPGRDEPQPKSAEEISEMYETLAKAIKEEAAKLDDVKYHLERDGIEQDVKKVAKTMIAKGKSNDEIMGLIELTLEEEVEVL